ncbi:NUDIX domain-containing protein [Paradesulfitobacterium aromaticivorans]
MPARHTFSHRHWDLYWLIIPISNQDFPDLIKETQNPPKNSRWLSLKELDSAPVPTAFHAHRFFIQTRAAKFLENVVRISHG